MRGLAGKKVVVTGGTSGIGAATAQRFRDEGCEVVVLARTPGPDVVQCDVGDREQVERAFAQIGALDVLVDNAGVSVRSPALDIGADQWEQVVATNLSGAFWVAQAAARRMLAGDGGVILFTASTNALVGYRYYADYNATKAGLVALTRSLALEWAPRIRVNAVCPGYVLTPMQEAEYTPEMLAAGEPAHPARASRDARGARRPVRLPRRRRGGLLHRLGDRHGRRRDGRQRDQRAGRPRRMSAPPLTVHYHVSKSIDKEGVMHRILRHRPSPAMIVACVALFISLGGTSYAAITLPAGSVGTSRLKSNAVVGSEVKAGSLALSGISGASLRG